MKKPPKTLVARKLLVAAVGVATVNLAAAACGNNETSGNLPAPNPTDSAVESAPDTAIPPTSGNLVGPGPVDAADAGEDADASDAADAEDADGA